MVQKQSGGEMAKVHGIQVFVAAVVFQPGHPRPKGIGQRLQIDWRGGGQAGCGRRPQQGRRQGCSTPDPATRLFQKQGVRTPSFSHIDIEHRRLPQVLDILGSEHHQTCPNVRFCGIVNIKSFRSDRATAALFQPTFQGAPPQAHHPRSLLVPLQHVSRALQITESAFFEKKTEMKQRWLGAVHRRGAGLCQPVPTCAGADCASTLGEILMDNRGPSKQTNRCWSELTSLGSPSVELCSGHTPWSAS